MNIYIWFAIFIAAVVLEACTSALIAIWFAPSALICMLLAFLNVPTVPQVIIFVVLSTVLMLLFYKKLKDNISLKSEKTNLDALIGKTAVVEEDITPLAVGRVKVCGLSWSAYCSDTETVVKKGEYVTIEAIDGVKLLCSRVSTAKDKSFVFDSKQN